MDDLRDWVNRVLGVARETMVLTTHRHTPWELMHAALGLGPDTPVLDERNGQRITLREYFRRGGPYFSESIYVVYGNDVQMRKSRHRSEIERHPNQFLAKFAQFEFPPEMTIESDAGTFTIADMVETAKRNFDPAAETSWTLIALAAYGTLDDAWADRYGQFTTSRDVLAHELEVTPGELLACGGAHRLFALAFASSRWKTNDDELLRKVEVQLAESLAAIRAAQQSDGSFPASLLDERTRSSVRLAPDEATILRTGHHLEWVLVALPDEDLHAPWVRRAVRYLGERVIERDSVPPSGSWCHALHALRLYRERTAAPRETSG